MIVVDASVVVTALLVTTARGDRYRRRLAADELHAPHVVDLEVISALRRRRAARALDDQRAAAAVEDLMDLPITRYPHRPLTPRIWELRPNVNPYDAAYVALAEALGCPLVTADSKLARSPGLRCEVELIDATA
ncbi:MAG TPA: type II toxin-antitoxin system VapC family toxin [Actinomycetota bacterium]|nr:type II toxin-antitoxin system VapC family toxin [Actinomycetota bacterium]